MAGEGRGGDGTVRLFVALGLPAALRTRLSWMASGLPGARWVPPENYHITLRFIGEVPAWRAEELDHALAALRAPGFGVTLAGVGAFEKGGKIVSLWASVERNPALDHLQSKIETALHRAGLDSERRRFTPHVTLGRVEGVAQGKVASWVQSNNLFRSDTFPVEHFTLYRSRLGKEQAVYDAEVEYPLHTLARASTGDA